MVAAEGRRWTFRRRAHRARALLDALRDERSRRVVFLSHCLLNENVRYAGGAFRAGSVDEVVDRYRELGAGLCQMPCPEQRAWGGVLKTRMAPAIGSTTPIRDAARRLLLPPFLASSTIRMWFTAHRVVREIEDYVRSGFEVIGVVGVGGSPSCGVRTTLDLRGAMRSAACPLATLDRDRFNRTVVAGNVRSGQGLFVAALRRQLRRRKLAVPMLEHDLIAEMAGRLDRVASNAS